VTYKTITVFVVWYISRKWFILSEAYKEERHENKMPNNVREMK
jgi:hypothetical protein